MKKNLLKYRDVNVNVAFAASTGQREAGIEDGSGETCTTTTITELHNNWRRDPHNCK